ncbi:hypothetical protein Vafri_5033 [Volvox africanus]|uniref:Uncharacterized protein n=1 Tax=Volvox africanus TaxID=51714 RepID=A0A8J4AV67_9CHLO|nr:hypothetical protein Vafri_5033 [Volvox africanus]
MVRKPHHPTPSAPALCHLSIGLNLVADICLLVSVCLSVCHLSATLVTSIANFLTSSPHPSFLPPHLAPPCCCHSSPLLRSQTALPNKRSLNPFAEAVLAGHIEAAEVLGAAMDGGLERALACTYRDVPLLHLAAGLGQAAAVEWLLRQQPCNISATTGERRYTPLHAAALSADASTVELLLRLGADPLAQTLDGVLPLELVPRAAPCKALLSPSSTAPPAAAAEDPDAAAAGADPLPVRLARRAFRQLARAAAEQGGVELGASTTSAAAKKTHGHKAATVSSRSATSGEKAGVAAAAAATTTAEGAEESEEFSSPAAICLRQLLSMTSEQQVAKVESYARMIERQVQELSYLDVNAQAAVTALRQAMGMVESFGWGGVDVVWNR